MDKEKTCIIGENVKIGENVTFGYNVIIEDDVTIGDNSYIDSNSIIRSNVTLGENSFIGANCIIGEYWMDFCIGRKKHCHPLIIGKDALIRSGSIIYAGSTMGEGFQTGHQVTIREKAKIGNHVSVGTLSDIQGNCEIGNYVRMHSNVHIGQLSVADDFVWIYPYVVLTNDLTPPSDHFVGGSYSSLCHCCNWQRSDAGNRYRTGFFSCGWMYGNKKRGTIFCGHGKSWKSKGRCSRHKEQIYRRTSLPLETSFPQLYAVVRK